MRWEDGPCTSMINWKELPSAKGTLENTKTSVGMLSAPSDNQNEQLLNIITGWVNWNLFILFPHLSSSSTDSSLTMDSLLVSLQLGLWSPFTLLAELLYPEDSPGNKSKPAPFLIIRSSCRDVLSTFTAWKCIQSEDSLDTVKWVTEVWCVLFVSLHYVHCESVADKVKFWRFMLFWHNAITDIIRNYFELTSMTGMASYFYFTAKWGWRAPQR
jgi:hypothetical protein